MAEAATECVNSVVLHTPATKLLKCLCGIATTEKSHPVRSACMTCIVIALQEWPTAVVDRQLDAVVGATALNIEHASGAVRETSRDVFRALRRVPGTRRATTRALHQLPPPPTGHTHGAEASYAAHATCAGLAGRSPPLSCWRT